MNVKRLADLVRFSDDKMQKVSLFQSERMFCDQYCLLPGQAQKVHAHGESDKVYYVVEGRARVTVGADTADLVAGEAVSAPAGQDHGVENPTDEKLRVLVFMAPPPSH